MAYAQLNSPLPNLTLPLNGCCDSDLGATVTHRNPGTGFMGDDSGIYDPSYVDDFGDLTSPYMEPVSTLGPVESGSLPLTPVNLNSNLTGDYPVNIGTEFVLVGPNQYVNIQTGQTVPMSVAQEVTAATIMPTTVGGSSYVSTSGTEQGVNLSDPTTGQSYSGTLTAAAQALQATGQLVTAAGKLTAQGQALAQSGQLISAPATGSSVSAALSSLSSWFTQQSLIAGFPNWGVMAGGIAALAVISAYTSSRPKRRKR